jgi:hypothetical protein
MRIRAPGDGDGPGLHHGALNGLCVGPRFDTTMPTEDGGAAAFEGDEETGSDEVATGSTAVRDDCYGYGTSAGTLIAWLTQWLHEKRPEADKPSAVSHETVCLLLHVMTCLDQLDASNRAVGENIVRQVQLVEEKHRDADSKKAEGAPFSLDGHPYLGAFSTDTETGTDDLATGTTTVRDDCHGDGTGAGTPIAWLTKWLPEKRLEVDHPCVVSHETVCRLLLVTTCFDQLDASNCAGGEIFVRQVQLVEEKYPDAGSKKAQGDSASLDSHLYLGTMSTPGGLCICPALKFWISDERRREASVMRERCKAREEREIAGPKQGPQDA